MGSKNASHRRNKLCSDQTGSMQTFFRITMEYFSLGFFPLTWNQPKLASEITSNSPKNCKNHKNVIRPLKWQKQGWFMPSRASPWASQSYPGWSADHAVPFPFQHSSKTHATWRACRQRNTQWHLLENTCWILVWGGDLLEMCKKENEDCVLFECGLGRAYEGGPKYIFILFLVGII